MGRPKKGPVWLVVHADGLLQVAEGENRDIEGELEGNFLDKLQCPTADGVLRALRKCFSLAYPDEHSDESFKQAVTQIGDVAREALLPVGDDVLTSLRLKPVGRPRQNPRSRSTLSCLSVARKADLDIKAPLRG